MAVPPNTSASIVFETKVLKVNPASIHFAKDAHITGALPTFSDPETERNLQEAVEILQKTNYNVAFPTETVYGLGGSSLNDEAILNIYKSKNRPSDNPLITHISSLNQLNRVIYHSAANTHTGNWNNIPVQYHKLIENLWPGPLTILLPVPQYSPSFSSAKRLSALTTAGQPTFAVRLPSHPVARALIAMSDLPIAAPSANTSTKPSPTCASHVYHDLHGKIPLILDGGECSVGVESSVIDCVTSAMRKESEQAKSENELILLRPGGFTLEEISKMSEIPVSDIKVECVLKNENSNVRTPGMKYKHYSPSCKVYLFVPMGKPEAHVISHEYLVNQIKDLSALHESVKKIAILTTYHFDNLLKKEPCQIEGIEVIVKSLGSDGGSIQRNIFKYLRNLDETDKVDVIFIEGVPEENEGLAIMNRLNKSSGGNTIPFCV